MCLMGLLKKGFCFKGHTYVCSFKSQWKYICIYKYIVQYVLTYFSIDVLHDWSGESTNEIEELLQFCAGVVGRLKGVLIERYR
jgi:hypothetical protein